MDRYLDLKALLAKKSYFLLGPRQTRKTCLLLEQLKGTKTYNLLERKGLCKVRLDVILTTYPPFRCNKYVSS